MNLKFFKFNIFTILSTYLIININNIACMNEALENQIENSNYNFQENLVDQSKTQISIIAPQALPCFLAYSYLIADFLA